MGDKKRKTNWAKVIIVQLIIFLILGEIVTRNFFPSPFVITVNTVHRGTAEKDQELGWIAKSNVDSSFQLTEKDGSTHTVNYRTTNDGFREYGNVNEDSLKKVLFIGDSFTQAVEVSNEETYYHLMRSHLPIEVFAFGTAGYGSHQQYLILKKHLEEIKPDLVVLQFCTNDFVDNYHKLEMVSNYRNSLRRPYFYDGELEYHTALSTSQYLSRHSNLYYSLYRLYRTVFKVKPGEQLIAEDVMEYPYYNRTVELTGQVFKKMKELVEPESKLVMFCADSWQPQLKNAADLSWGNDIPFYETHIHKLNESRDNGKTFVSADGVHWNALGHQIVARYLSEDIKKHIIEQ